MCVREQGDSNKTAKRRTWLWAMRKFMNLLRLLLVKNNRTANMFARMLQGIYRKAPFENLLNVLD
jgi:hypothetical protein